MKLKNNVKGITLIALVVTIIVLLILAGIALNLTIGENGLFTRAQNAANTWQLAEQNEQNAMNSLAGWIDSVSGEKDNNEETEPTYTNIFAQLYDNEDGTETLIFTSDENYREGGKEPKDSWDITDEHFSTGETMNMPPWLDASANYMNSTIKTVKIVDKIKPKYTTLMLAGLIVLEDIKGMENLNTENTVDMSSMFESCMSLTSLDLSNLDTRNVTDMSMMFSQCTSLTSLDLSNFNTDNVTNMSMMFLRCESLTSLDLSSFNTSNVTNMSRMFEMSSGYKLESITFGEKFNTSRVTDMSYMFCQCRSLTGLDLSNFDTKSVTDMLCMFESCESLTSLDLASFNTNNVTNMSMMINSCKSLTSLVLSSNFDTSNVTDMSAMFSGCISLINLDLSNFDTSNVTDMSYMFSGCTNLSTIYAGPNWTTKNADTSDMFEGCGTQEVTPKN